MEPIVTLSEGKIRGREYKDFDNNPYYAFKGIPYAKPPLGNLRFRAPQLPEKWDGVKDCFEHGGCCRSRGMLRGTVYFGGEDCLYLNVYTAKLFSKDKLYPVMFYIHGGGFIEGDSNVDMLGPEYLVAEGVIFVTFNYRYGALGFVGFKDPKVGIPGNAGMKDIVFALEWTKRNIAQFGGDPNNVTIFGESSGAASVHHLIASPMAKGLFHRSICMSGTATAEWSMSRGSPYEIAKVLGFTSTDDQDLYQYLKDLPLTKLCDIEAELRENMIDLRKGITFLWGPTIEVPCDAEPSFLTESPREIFRSGRANDVPMMFGYVSSEGMLMISPASQKELLLAPDFTDKETTVPIALNLKRGSEESIRTGEEIQNFYYGNTNPSMDNLLPYIDLAGDVGIVYPTISAIKMHVAKHKNPVFLYRFGVDTPFSVYKKLFGLTLPGTVHAADLCYIFANKITHYKPDINTLEGKTLNRMVNLFVSFATNGVPVLPDSDVKWLNVTSEKLNYLSIEEEVTLKSDDENPEIKRINFWLDLEKKCSKV